MGKNGGRKDAGINPFKDYLMMVGWYDLPAKQGYWIC
jgi:hypothetical protein